MPRGLKWRDRNSMALLRFNISFYFLVCRKQAKMLCGAELVSTKREFYRAAVFKIARCWAKVRGVEWDRVKDPLYNQCPKIPDKNERLVLTQEAQDHLIAVGIFLLESPESHQFAQIIIPYLLEIMDRLPDANIASRRFQDYSEFTGNGTPEDNYFCKCF